MLGIICTVYATVITVRSLWGWLVYFSAPDRVTSMLKRYTVVQLLRLRLSRFSGEFVQLGLWIVVLAYLIRLHEL